jgi:hypothetical protein
VTLLTRGFFKVLFKDEKKARFARKVTIVEWSGLNSPSPGTFQTLTLSDVLLSSLIVINNEKVRSLGHVPNSQHFTGVEGHAEAPR